MKQIFFSLLFLLASVAFAQDYRPFLPGKLHYFTSSPNYSVRIDSVGEISGDSVFWMNEIAIVPPLSCFINWWAIPAFIPGHEGYFGDHFTHKPDGSYLFVNRAGDTAVFHTRLPTGTPWTFLSDSTLTAVISARIQVIVAGVLDSVLVMDVSDGQQYQLSEHFGLTEGPNVSYYLNDDLLRSASIAYLPYTPDWRNFIDWQPGDVRLTHFQINNPAAYQDYDLCEVIARNVSPNQDSIQLVSSCQRVRIWGGGPTQFFFFQDTLLYTQAALKGLEWATYEVYFGPEEFLFQQPWTTGFNNRLVLPFYYQFADGYYDSCGFYPNAAAPCNMTFPRSWTHNLGETYHRRPAGSTITHCQDGTFSLICYMVAGQDSSGDCRNMYHAVPADDPYGDAHITLYRDPTTGLCGLNWESVPAGNYHWQLHDLNGRLIWERDVEMAPVGRAPVHVTGARGMYVLRISHETGDWGKSLMFPLVAD